MLPLLSQAKHRVRRQQPLRLAPGAGVDSQPDPAAAPGQAVRARSSAGGKHDPAELTFYPPENSAYLWLKCNLK